MRGTSYEAFSVEDINRIASRTASTAKIDARTPDNRIRMHEVVDFGGARGTSAWRFSTVNLHPCTEAAERLAAAGMIVNIQFTYVLCIIKDDLRSCQAFIIDKLGRD